MEIEWDGDKKTLFEGEMRRWADKSDDLKLGDAQFSRGDSCWLKRLFSDFLLSVGLFPGKSSNIVFSRTSFNDLSWECETS